MAASKRIYLLEAAGKKRLVKAPNKYQATDHVAADTITCRVATQLDLVDALAAGIKVEDVSGAAPVQHPV